MLDLRAIAAKGANLAYNISQQVWKDATLKFSPGSGTYDPVTDTTAPTTSPDITVKALKYRTHQQQAADTTGNTQTLLIRQQELRDKGYTQPLKEVDRVNIEGIWWNVEGIDYDPADALYILAVRYA